MQFTKFLYTVIIALGLNAVSAIFAQSQTVTTIQAEPVDVQIQEPTQPNVCKSLGAESRENGTCYCKGKNRKFQNMTCESVNSLCESGRYRDDKTSKCQTDEGRQNAQSTGTRGDFGRSPMEILDNVMGEANQGPNAIQETALDDVSHNQGSYPFVYRLANTFDSIRKKSAAYLDWMIYIGLSVATILVIYQGLQLVVGKTFADIRPKLTNIVVGVVILTGVYLIIKIVTSLVALIFNL